MRTSLVAVLGLSVVFLGCAPLDASEPHASVAALGEPMDGFPSWEERVVHVWTNRARADPAADLASCTVCAERACYSPAPPVVWNHNLARAARFHSANLVLGGCGLQHDSPCTVLSTIGTLYTPGTCDGAPSCACQSGTFTCGSTGTAFGTRVGYFGSPASAENIARGRTDPVQTFYQWLHENDPSSACGWRIANGHRANILGGSRALGVGMSGTTWTQDFGSSGAPSGIVGGVHYPRTGSAIELRANWYSTAAPRSAQVSVNGTCTALTVERGTATNGTYLASVSGLTGCNRYVFHFVDSAGADVTFPTSGAFTIGCGAADWESTRPATCGACTPSCGGRSCGDDGCGGSCGACSGGRTCSGAGACVCPAGRTYCGGTCVDVTTSAAHCGACGNACASGERCVGGSCTSSCTPSCGGRTCGSDGCAGTCGACDTGEACVAGACVSTTIDAGGIDAGGIDAGGSDAGGTDAGTSDGGGADAGSAVDTGPRDGGIGLDGGTSGSDAGPPGGLLGSCGCRAGRAQSGGPWVLALAALLLFRRRVSR